MCPNPKCCGGKVKTTRGPWRDCTACATVRNMIEREPERDAPSDAEVLVELLVDLVHVNAGGEVAPWVTRVAAAAQLEDEIERYKAKLSPALAAACERSAAEFVRNAKVRDVVGHCPSCGCDPCLCNDGSFRSPHEHCAGCGPSA